MFRNVMLSAVFLMLPGCISVLPDAGDLPPRITLDPGQAETGEPHFDATLVVLDPTSAAALNTFSVAVMTAPLEFQYLADAEWTDRAPVLVRRYLELRLENKNLFVAVADRADLVVSDYALQTDIRAFHIDRTTGDEVAKVTFGVRLLDRRNAIIATKTVSGTASVSMKSRQGRAQALNAAAYQATEDLSSWVQSTLLAQPN